MWKRLGKKMMMKLRGGTAGFEIETGRWRGVAREERVCKLCDSGEVEDVGHWLMRCEAWGVQHVPLEDWMERHTVSTQDPAASLLSVACTNYQLLEIISCMWRARFG